MYINQDPPFEVSITSSCGGVQKPLGESARSWKEIGGRLEHSDSETFGADTGWSLNTHGTAHHGAEPLPGKGGVLQNRSAEVQRRWQVISYSKSNGVQCKNDRTWRS